MIYLKSFLRRIKLKSALEFSCLLALLVWALSKSVWGAVISYPIFTGFFLLTATLINKFAAKKITNIKCKLCSFPHCDLLYPARTRQAVPEKKGSFACSSFDHGKYSDIYYCPSCHNGFLADMSVDRYEETKDHGDKLYKEVVDEQYLEQIDARLETYKNFIANYRSYFQGKDVLEIGCYYGAFYEKVSPFVRTYTGIEPSVHAGTYLRRKHPDLAFFNGLLEEAVQQKFLHGKSFDTIVLFDVLEHLPNPQETIVLLRSLLRDGGHLIYSTINIEAVISLVLGPIWPWFMDMHYYYFSDRGYRELLRQGGLTLAKHAHFPYTVSLEYFLSKITSLFLGRKLSFKGKIPKFNVPIKLGDTVLIIGEKATPSSVPHTVFEDQGFAVGDKVET